MQDSNNGERDTAATLTDNEVHGDGQERERHDTAEEGLVLRGSGEPDVLLEVPKLNVEEISLNVENLHARVSLHAAVVQLVALDVGADVNIDRVDLTIRGVQAEAQLKVRLDRVYDILARTLSTIDQNPQLLEDVIRPVADLSHDAGSTLEKTAPEVGKRVGSTVDKTASALAPKGTKRIRRRVVQKVRQAVGQAQKTVVGKVLKR